MTLGGMVIFETTCIKLSEKEGGGGHGVSRELLISGGDKSQAHHPLFGVVEALDELNRRALPRSAGADKGCGLSGLHRDTQLVQDLRGKSDGAVTKGPSFNYTS